MPMPVSAPISAASPTACGSTDWPWEIGFSTCCTASSAPSPKPFTTAAASLRSPDANCVAALYMSSAVSAPDCFAVMRIANTRVPAACTISDGATNAV